MPASSSPESRRRVAQRLKKAGLALLVLGVCSAPIYYWRATEVAEERLGDILPGYDRAMEREMQVQMGPLGLVLMQWSEALKQPGTQAFLIAAGAAIAARSCYYIAARVLDDDEQT